MDKGLIWQVVEAVEAVRHGQLGSYGQRLHFRKAIAAEVPWYMALVVWLGVEQGAVGGTGS